MATGGENFNPAYETFRKHSADLLTVIQNPEVLAWELYSKGVVSSTVVEFTNNMMHGRSTRTSNLLVAVDSQIEVDPRVFDVFLSVLDKRPTMSDLCGRMKDDYGKSPGPVMVKMDPPKLVPPGTNFLINKDPPELIFLQNMDSL